MVALNTHIAPDFNTRLAHAQDQALALLERLASHPPEDAQLRSANFQRLTATAILRLRPRDHASPTPRAAPHSSPAPRAAPTDDIPPRLTTTETRATTPHREAPAPAPAPAPDHHPRADLHPDPPAMPEPDDPITQDEESLIRSLLTHNRRFLTAPFPTKHPPPSAQPRPRIRTPKELLTAVGAGP